MIWRGLMAALIALVIAGCPAPPPPPPVNPPQDADAARPPASPSCRAGCQHADDVCPGAGDICNHRCDAIRAIDPGYTTCLVAAKACPDLQCDSVTRAQRGTIIISGPPIQHGR